MPLFMDVDDHDTRPRSLDPVQVGRDTGPMAHRQARSAFVGRGEELHLLDDALDGVLDGRPATVLVGGEAGIGKTRLVEELGARARVRGALAATGVCVPAEGGLPYAPIVGLLRDVARQRGDADASSLSPLADGVALGAADLGGRADVYSTMPRLADEMARTRLFESILVGFDDLAGQTPVVLILEDLHWADSGSAELLDFLTRNLADSRVLIVGTYRSEELGRAHPLRARLQELGRHPRVLQLALSGLDREEMAELIGGIVGHQPDWALLDAVLARSEGNPFFAEELTAARHSPTLSAELQGVIMTRVEGLSVDTRLLLQLAATAGSTADHDLLTAVGLLETATLDEALAEAVDRQLLVVEPDGTGYRFRHALLREAVDASLLPGERSRLHRALATALSERVPPRPDASGRRAAELALHWWAAGEWAEAFTCSVAAADADLAVLAFPEAFVHLERALAALDRLPERQVPSGVDRLALLERASDAAYHGGEGQASVDLARAAIDLIDADADPATAARFMTLLGRNAWSIGDSAAAFDSYRRAAALIPADPPSRELARVLAEDARGLMLMSRHRDAERGCHKAIAVARAVGARSEEGHAINTLGCCRSNLGHADEGIDLMRQALAIAEELNSPEDLNRAYGNLGSLLVDSGRLEEGAALVFDSAAIGEELWGARLNGAAGNSTDALVRLGRFDEAAALLAQIGSHGHGYCTPAPYLLPTAMLIRRGHYDEAGRLLQTADELTSGLGDVQERGAFHLLAAELALEEGRPDDAYQHVEQALTLAATTDDEISAPEMCALGVRALADQLEEARVHGRRVDPDKLRLLATGLVQEAERLVAGPAQRGGASPPRSEALVALCRAERSRLDEPEADLWAAAVGSWQLAGEPYPTAYCRWREAEALLEGRSGRSRAADLLHGAWRVSVDLRTDPLTRQIERLAQRARITLEDAEPGEGTTAATIGLDLGLTPREVEVLGHLARGETDGEIAESLFISKKTVSVHVSNLLRKLDVANRVEAGRIGQAHGL